MNNFKIKIKVRSITEFIPNVHLDMETTDRITNENIRFLKPDEVFVFGSNKSGIHGAGAARLALAEFGAIWHQSKGLQGQSYAIPTKDASVMHTLTISEIGTHVTEFIEFAKQNQDKIFFVTEIGCGLAGCAVEDIAPLFKHAVDVDNVHLPLNFWKYLND